MFYQTGSIASGPVVLSVSRTWSAVRSPSFTIRLLNFTLPPHLPSLLFHSCFLRGASSETSGHNDEGLLPNNLQCPQLAALHGQFESSGDTHIFA